MREIRTRPVVFFDSNGVDSHRLKVIFYELVLFSIGVVVMSVFFEIGGICDTISSIFLENCVTIFTDLSCGFVVTVRLLTD